MLERIGAISIITGTILGVVGLCWFVTRLVWVRIRKRPGKRRWTPLFLILISLLMTGTPIVVNSVMTRFTNLGEHNKIVGGERHLTLTGWDKTSYTPIAIYTDAIVLQMANSDVTDETLKIVKEMMQLRELDLNNSQVSDAGLSLIAQLPKLRDLRLARTKVTDEGFRVHLFGKESLMNLDLTGTSVASKTVREWKAMNPDRKALK